jgi:hypothetical protein
MRNERLVWSLLLSTLLAGQASADSRDREPPYTYRVAVKDAAHHAELVFHVRAFDRRNHVIKGGTDNLRIDGRSPLGTDGSLPKREIWKVEFTFDGQAVPIESRLFADCFEPHLFPAALVARMSDGGSGVFVFMHGSDAAGSYEVIWVFGRDGKHSRWSGDCPDCSLLDLDYFKE